MDRRQTAKLTKDPISKLLLSFCSQTTMSVMLYSFQSLINTYFVALALVLMRQARLHFLLPSC